MKKRYIKSIGFIDNQWQVILDDDSILDHIISIEIFKNVDSIGSIKIEVVPLEKK